MRLVMYLGHARGGARRKIPYSSRYPCTPTRRPLLASTLWLAGVVEAAHSSRGELPPPTNAAGGLPWQNLLVRPGVTRRPDYCVLTVGRGNTPRLAHHHGCFAASTPQGFADSNPYPSAWLSTPATCAASAPLSHYSSGVPR
jgi:hypothetical protein